MRDVHGNPAGTLLENAMGLMAKVIPSPTPEQEEEATVMAMHAMNKRGVDGRALYGRRWRDCVFQDLSAPAPSSAA